MAKPRTAKQKEGTLRASRDKDSKEPMPQEPLGAPVFKRMTKREKEWYELLAGMLHDNTAYRPDAVALSLIARQAAYIERTPMEDLPTSAQSEFFRNLSQFGMTPSSRRHVQTQVSKDEVNDGFGKFASKPGADSVRH